MSSPATTKVLIVKNLPAQADKLASYFDLYQPASVKSFGRRRVLLTFETVAEAYRAQQQLHNSEIQGRQITAELFFQRQKSNNNDGQKKLSQKQQTTVTMPQISDFVRQLYATHDCLNFSAPPPPYLRYDYPKITTDILDSISIALMSNTKFYTQVLHLMNRMNLDPPFGRQKKKFIPPGQPRDAATQTESVRITQASEEEESELESSDGELKRKQTPENVQNLKRKKIANDEELIRKKARKLLQSSVHGQKSLPRTNTATAHNLGTVFENRKSLVDQRIALKVNVNAKLPTQQHARTEVKQSSASGYDVFIVPEDLSINRIAEDQLKNLPVYKNYSRGERSHKLYVKNLAKDVTVVDLYSLYRRFAIDPVKIDIKLMQQGRMKGQAFVTFVGLENATLDADLKTVEKALSETNGFLLRNKPMIVCFGKK